VAGSRAIHDPGKVIADLAAAVALSGDCLADIAILRGQPGPAGPVASDPVVSRLVSALAAADGSSPWTGSWNGGLSNPSSTAASTAITRAISAARGRGAPGRTSCKRQVSGSNPLTGS
jgi:hypothetical protein